MQGHADEIELAGHVAMVRVVSPWVSTTEVEGPIVLHVVGLETQSFPLGPGNIVLVGGGDRIGS